MAQQAALDDASQSCISRHAAMITKGWEARTNPKGYEIPVHQTSEPWIVFTTGYVKVEPTKRPERGAQAALSPSMFLNTNDDG